MGTRKPKSIKASVETVPRVKAAKSPKPPKIDPVSEAERLVLSVLESSSAVWLTSIECGSGIEDSTRKKALKRLATGGQALSLGKLGKVEVFIAARGSGPASLKEQLLVGTLRRRKHAEQLVAVSLATTPAAHPDLPAGLRQILPGVIAKMVQANEAYPITFSGTGKVSFVALTSTMRELVGMRATPPARPVQRERRGLDPERVYRAYERLKQRTGSPHVVISDLQRESGAELGSLKSWLRSECEVHRATPTTGEPAIASDEQRAAALDIRGRIHLMIRLQAPSQH